MKNFDWQLVKKSVTIFALTTIAMLAITGVSYYINSAASTEYKNANNKLDSIKSNYTDLINKNNIFVEYAKKYKQLKHKGIIGQENRLTWIEALQETNNSLKLPSLQYTISPQVDYPLELIGPDFYDVSIKKTSMDISMGILHEEDMLNILTGLQNKARGHFLIDKCTITPNEIPTSDDINVNIPILKADCNIHWLQVTLLTPDNMGVEQ